MFRNNTYPNVKNPILFLCSIEELINNYMKSDEYEAYYFEKEDITLEIIKKEITQAKKLGLPLLINNKPGKLIEEYYQMYLQRLVLFNNSELIFDHEIDVEEKLGSLDVGNKNFIFVESNILKAKEKSEFLGEETHKLVQLSDIVVGIMGMFLNYINSSDEKFLQNIYEATNWNEKQCQVYDKWVSIINNSIQENSFFKMAVADEFIEHKFNFFTGERFKRVIKNTQNS